MTVTRLTSEELVDLLATPFAHDELVDEPASVVVVEPSPSAESVTSQAVEALRTLPAVIIGTSDGVDPALVDLVVIDEADHDRVLATVSHNPLASVAMALLLRSSDRRGVGEGLVAESTTYSMLQGGPEFAAWRASRAITDRGEPDAGPPVRWWREGDVLDVVLDRPRVHNAYSSAMRDGLVEALAVAAADPAVHVHLRGEGPSFCSGGDLDEFGSRSDPATAHGVRLRRSAARMLHDLAPRSTAHLHGACMGSGIELPAFAGRVLARSDTKIGLPEVSLGLIPGAGGTVSLPRRIGRHRTMLLALSATTIDVATALRWGLVDAVDE